jgi:Spy/CpxP family protein refolding chaperone
MHPAFYFWWKHARRGAHGHGQHAHAGHCGPGMRAGRGEGGPPFDARFGGGPDDGWFGGPFGVRRPLRFLANKLELSEAQMADLARIIDELKTERAQADVDHRRTVAAFADALEGATFGDARAREGGDLRVKSAERLREAVISALGKIHALLDEEQRKRFSYLIRTGVVSL